MPNSGRRGTGRDQLTVPCLRAASALPGQLGLQEVIGQSELTHQSSLGDRSAGRLTQALLGSSEEGRGMPLCWSAQTRPALRHSVGGMNYAYECLPGYPDIRHGDGSSDCLRAGNGYTKLQGALSRLRHARVRSRRFGPRHVGPVRSGTAPPSSPTSTRSSCPRSGAAAATMWDSPWASARTSDIARTGPCESAEVWGTSTASA